MSITCRSLALALLALGLSAVDSRGQCNGSTAGPSLVFDLEFLVSGHVVSEEDLAIKRSIPVQ